MNQKIFIIFGAVILLVGGSAFYGGIKYDQGKNRADRQFRTQQFGGSNGGPRGARTGNGFAGGEVISKDDKSITIKLQDGGSKIVFVSDSTAVMKSTQGSFGDVAVGGQVMATGSQNPDGSISAQSIQIRSIVQPAAPLSSADQSANIK